jgi:hypothetical protein
MPGRHVTNSIEIGLPAQQLWLPLQRSSLLKGLLQHLRATPSDAAEQSAALVMVRLSR